MLDREVTCAPWALGVCASQILELTNPEVLLIEGVKSVSALLSAFSNINTRWCFALLGV